MKLSAQERGRLGWIATIDYRKSARELRVASYANNPKLCKSCKAPLTYARKRSLFCNQSCAASFNNIGIVRRGSPVVFRSCVICQTPYSRGNAGFCSVSCHQTKVYLDYVEKWISGLESGLTASGQDITGYVRRYCLTRANGKCERCGWAEVNPKSGTVPVQVHHKNGFYNNRPEDLEVLCPNCHSLTDTYCGSNRGNGRKHRKDRYLSVKSSKDNIAGIV